VSTLLAVCTPYCVCFIKQVNHGWKMEIALGLQKLEISGLLKQCVNILIISPCLRVEVVKFVREVRPLRTNVLTNSSNESCSEQIGSYLANV
jgi:hypothetical protein